ncbi:hypothetical protein FIBSPDRAFT_100882 [Athelia psychrophila]|uniref:Uncharacterized protein n=1 Tax=Athelia psychrophila TaxID=1759441 RepID=A0A166DJX1_9AGAM|nr:hypothetical protein FIBSPDRAFT_100882 [Fibularhizoctonia sp. CBS 109695]
MIGHNGIDINSSQSTCAVQKAAHADVPFRVFCIIDMFSAVSQDRQHRGRSIALQLPGRSSWWQL